MKDKKEQIIDNIKNSKIEKAIKILQNNFQDRIKNDGLDNFFIHGFNLLHWAALFSCRDCIFKLIDYYKFDVNKKCEGIEKNKIDVYLNQTFLDKQEEDSLNASSKSVRSEEQKNVEIVQILSQNVKRTRLDYIAYTPLMVASEYGQLESCKILINLGANINEQDYNDDNALMRVSYHGYNSIMKLFIQHKAKIDNENSNGWTALMYACSSNKLTSVKILLNEKANPWKQNKYGANAFMKACEYGNSAIIKTILKCSGKNVERMLRLRDEDKWTALMYSCIRCKSEIIYLLMENSAKLKVKSISGRSPLMIAVENGNFNLVKLFVEQLGCDVNQKNKDGRNALYLAILNAQEKIGKYLKNKNCKLVLDSYGMDANVLNSGSSINKDFFFKV